MHIKTFGPVDARSLEQLEPCMSAGDADCGVLCADHHPGYSQPIGGAVAYEGYVSPSGVGYDIGCGNKAVQTDLTRGDLDDLGGVEAIMGRIMQRHLLRDGCAGARAGSIIRCSPDPRRGVRSAAQAGGARGVPAGNSRFGQPLRQPHGGRGRSRVGRGALRLPRVRAQDGIGFLALAQGLAFDGRAHEGEMDSPPVLLESTPSWASLHRGDAAGGRVRLCGP